MSRLLQLKDQMDAANGTYNPRIAQADANNESLRRGAEINSNFDAQIEARIASMTNEQREAYYARANAAVRHNSNN